MKACKERDGMGGDGGPNTSLSVGRIRHNRGLDVSLVNPY